MLCIDVNLPGCILGSTCSNFLVLSSPQNSLQPLSSSSNRILATPRTLHQADLKYCFVFPEKKKSSIQPCQGQDPKKQQFSLIRNYAFNLRR